MEQISRVIKRHNQGFLANPRLQLKGKAAERSKGLMDAERTSKVNYDLMQEKVGATSWADGPWAEGMMGVQGFFAGEPARDISHPYFAPFFLGTERSQHLCIQWNHSEYDKRSQRMDTPMFAGGVRRFVLANRVGELFLVPSGVSAARVRAFEQDVFSGMHHDALEAMYSKALPELTSEKCKEWLKEQLPFVDTIISAQKRESMGLTAEKVAEIKAQTDVESSRQYKNKILMDVSTYFAVSGCYGEPLEAYTAASQNHAKEAKENASKAASKFLFGITEQDTVGKHGWVRVVHKPLATYATQVVSIINDFTRECLGTLNL